MADMPVLVLQAPSMHTSVSRLTLLFIAIILVTSVTCNNINNNNSVDTELLDRLHGYCPYLSTCSRSASSKFPASSPEFGPCCQQCSCNDGCQYTQDCCPDFTGNRTHSPDMHLERFETCISSAYPDPRPNGYSSRALMFRTVTSCPETYPNATIVSLCADSSPETLLQAALVSDDVGTIYRNSYCAMCHRVTEVTRWDLKVEYFPDTPNEAFIPSLSGIIQKYGLVKAQLPRKNYKTFLKKRCYLPEISTCNVTGRWDVYNEFTKRACETTESLEYMTAAALVYKNVFCFKCNNPSTSSNHFLKCSKDQFLRGVTFRFSAILNPDVLEQQPRTTSEITTRKCKLNEMYDSNFKTCRELLCPPDFISQEGRCVQTYLLSDGLNVKLFYTIHRTKRPKYFLPFDDEAKQFVAAINARLISTLEALSCSFCACSYHVDFPHPGFFTLRQIISTSNTCPVSAIVESPFAGNQTVMSIDFKGKPVNFTVERADLADDVPEWNRANPDLTASLLEMMSDCIPDGIPASHFRCPRVKMSGLDYVTALRKRYIRETTDHYTFNVSAFDDVTLANMTYEVCTEDYYMVNAATVRVCDLMALTLVLVATVSSA